MKTTWTGANPHQTLSSSPGPLHGLMPQDLHSLGFETGLWVFFLWSVDRSGGEDGGTEPFLRGLWCHGPAEGRRSCGRSVCPTENEWWICHHKMVWFWNFKFSLPVLDLECKIWKVWSIKWLNDSYKKTWHGLSFVHLHKFYVHIWLVFAK